MTYLVRFDMPGSDAVHAYLKEGECGLIEIQDKMDATRFESEDAAYAAMGRFLSGCEFTTAQVEEDEPELLCSTTVNGRLIELSIRSGTYFVSGCGRSQYCINRAQACSMFGQRMDDALRDAGK